MSKCKTFAIVASAWLWLAVSGGVLAGTELGVNVGKSCEELGQIVQLLEDANAGIEGISSHFDLRFTDVDERLRFLAERSRPFDLSIVVDEQACASGAIQCRCQTNPGPGPGADLDASSAGIPGFGRGNLMGSDRRGGVERAAVPNYNPIAVNILVSKNGTPVIGLTSSAFTFSLAFGPVGGPTVLSWCGTQAFLDAGNGVYRIWLWPQDVSWVPGTYVGRLDVTDDDGFTVNTLVPIRIQ